MLSVVRARVTLRVRKSVIYYLLQYFHLGTDSMIIVAQLSHQESSEYTVQKAYFHSDAKTVKMPNVDWS